jgi:DNA polymerase III sliding clamp (beta) subunit (PCNA family)
MNYMGFPHLGRPYYYYCYYIYKYSNKGMCMKFTCERSVLLKEISIAQEIISSKNAISILSNIYLEAVDNVLVIKATDMKVNFETRVPIDMKENFHSILKIDDI